VRIQPVGDLQCRQNILDYYRIAIGIVDKKIYTTSIATKREGAYAGKEIQGNLNKRRKY
jgi:hypothetical protein